MNNFEPDTRRQSTADKNLHTKDEEGTAGFDVTCNGVRSFSEYEINNPFRLPSTTDVTKFLQQEKEKERVEHKLFLRKPIHMKTTKSGREGTMCSDILKSIPPVHLPKEPPKSPTNNIRSDPEFLKALATGEKMRNMENVSSFVKTKREMFLLQYLIGVKTDELMKMDEHEKDKVQRLEIQEKELEEDAIKFDTFLKSNDREAVEASKHAEMETKIKYEKIAEIKKIHVQISSIRSEINKLEEVLLEYRKYKKFLFGIAPLEWQNEHTKQTEIKKPIKTLTKLAGPHTEKRHSISAKGQLTPRISRTRRSSIGIHTLSHMGSASSLGRMRQRSQKDADAQILYDLESSSSSINVLYEESLVNPSVSGVFIHDDDDDLDNVAIYFKHPKELLDIFVDLEEMNLMFIQKSQETEESLEEVQESYNRIKRKLGKEQSLLKRQIGVLEQQVAREKKKAEEFEIMSKIYSFGEFNEHIQEQMLQELNLGVQDVYESILGPNNVNLSTIQMMISIENKLEELLEIIDTLPAGKVETAVKLQDRQRRIQQRQEKLKQQQELQLERMRRTVAKALAIPRKVTGRKLMFRSAPPQPKTVLEKAKWRSREDQEETYFFS